MTARYGRVMCWCAWDYLRWVFSAPYHPCHDRVGLTTAQLYAMDPVEIVHHYSCPVPRKRYNRRRIWYLLRHPHRSRYRRRVHPNRFRGKEGT